MKKTSILAAAVVVILASLTFAANGIQWLSLEEGREMAKKENKPMIVDFFFGKGCPRCEMLQKAVYDEPSIAEKIMKDFVPIRVDLTKALTREEEKLGEQYDYKKDCLLLFMDSKGNIVKDPRGKRLCFVENIEPEMFIQYLDMVKASMKDR
ncbi:MAG TPA: thioredoxin family protein [Thermodesulfovibrionales bacterium]|jgi:thioredoxin-related protein|nr:thioredoxin family protein [Thermodesulfovibrionales bacterium]